MRLATRSNLLAGLAGGLSIMLGRWGRYAAWWWYDLLAHFLAGLALGSAIASADSPVYQDLAIVLSIATGWEILEYRIGAYPHDDDLEGEEREPLPAAAAAEDTFSDTLLVGLGALVGAMGAKR